MTKNENFPQWSSSPPHQAVLRDSLRSTFIDTLPLIHDEFFGLHRNTAKNSDATKWKQVVSSTAKNWMSPFRCIFQHWNNKLALNKHADKACFQSKSSASYMELSGYDSAASYARRDPAISILITAASPGPWAIYLHPSSLCIWSLTGLRRPDILTNHSCWISRAVTGGRGWASPADRALQRAHVSTNQKPFKVSLRLNGMHLHPLHCCSGSTRRICSEFSWLWASITSNMINTRPLSYRSTHQTLENIIVIKGFKQNS